MQREKQDYNDRRVSGICHEAKNSEMMNFDAGMETAHRPVSGRIEKMELLLKRESLDCFVAAPSSDFVYLSDCRIHSDERFQVLVLSPGREPFLLANALSAPQLEDGPVTDRIYWMDGEDPFLLLTEELKRRSIPAGHVAVNESMTARFLLKLMEALPGVQIVNGSSLVSSLRMYKDPEEMNRMRLATQKGELALKKCMERGTEWIGRTEAEFQTELILEMNRQGIENGGALVAVGANAASAHHAAGDTRITRGSCLMVDFGGTFRNYYTDMTRTFYFGTPPDQFRDVYQIVLEANLAGEAAVKAGNRLCEVDFAARSVIERYGYGEYFTHRTGHGIGLDCHEGVGPEAGEQTRIGPGMAFSCEPGIYLPGRFGVRIEDQVLIAEDGTTEILHRMPKELMIYE